MKKGGIPQGMSKILYQLNRHILKVKQDFEYFFFFDV